MTADETTGAGPLGGLSAALGQIRTGLAFVCPGDAPLVDPALLRLLSAALADHQVAVPHDGERSQHLFMLVRASVAGDLRVALALGVRRVVDWLARVDTVEVDASTLAPAFANVNRFDELAALQASLERPPAMRDGQT